MVSKKFYQLVWIKSLLNLVNHVISEVIKYLRCLPLLCTTSLKFAQVAIIKIAPPHCRLIIVTRKKSIRACYG